jgi:hypothetical protein
MDERGSVAGATRHWTLSWTGLAVALGLHVADEAANDFLAFWNPLVRSLPASPSYLQFRAVARRSDRCGRRTADSDVVCASWRDLDAARVLCPRSCYGGERFTAYPREHL